MNDLSLYESVRGQMNTGDLLLWGARSLLGEVIRLFSRSNVNHASIVCRLKGLQMDRVFNYESESSGFGPHYLSKELQGYNGQVFWYRLKGDADRAAIEDRIFIFDGTPYDYGCLFKMAASHPEINTREMICSESSEVCVTGNISGVVHSPGELPGLGYWEPGIQIL